MRKKRRYFKAEEKVLILKRHLVGREEVSAICEDVNIHPNMFYTWQRLFFENGANAFISEQKSGEHRLEKQLKKLESKLQTKNEVLSELMEEHVALKKNLGEL